MTRQFQVTLDGTVQNIYNLLYAAYIAEYPATPDLYLPNNVSFLRMESDAANAVASTVKIGDAKLGVANYGMQLAPGDYDPMGPFDTNLINLSNLYVQSSAGGLKANIQIASK